ncbi:4Fe-4S dicluster domain-containing protein [Adlercreutzia sp. R7]|uniref:4Fe-4S dicluster domain-containing protein n=1 Tax=Adlercreutzia wanghongyangiae TaxID=3111451 RepID=A0ABU6IK63_9ACTN|nr:4Fe-4S dicluster domain-containing protein [Adlercreutzia sp. R7]
MTRYGMVIDLKNCVACHACSVACKSNNNLPNNVWFNRVVTDGGDYMDTARGEYPNNLYRAYYPVSCQHCGSPVCVEVCPTAASYVREDGVVAIDHDLCTGCQTCMKACPYDVRTLLDDEVAYAVDFPLGDADAPTHVGGTVVKCDFCAHRLDRGKEPACMELCPGRARFWGDFDDPDSTVSKLIARRDYEQLKTEDGTEPRCFYLK